MEADYHLFYMNYFYELTAKILSIPENYQVSSDIAGGVYEPLSDAVSKDDRNHQLTDRKLLYYSI